VIQLENVLLIPHPEVHANDGVVVSKTTSVIQQSILLWTKNLLKKKLLRCSLFLCMKHMGNHSKQVAQKRWSIARRIIRAVNLQSLQRLTTGWRYQEEPKSSKTLTTAFVPLVMNFIFIWITSGVQMTWLQLTANSSRKVQTFNTHGFIKIQL